MNEDQYKVLLGGIRDAQEGIARIDRDLERDRRDLQDFSVRLAAVEEEIKQLRKAVSSQVNRVKDGVADAVLPVMAEAQDLRKTIEKKRTLVLESMSLIDKVGGWFK